MSVIVVKAAVRNAELAREDEYGGAHARAAAAGAAAAAVAAVAAVITRKRSKISITTRSTVAAIATNGAIILEKAIGHRDRPVKDKQGTAHACPAAAAIASLGPAVAKGQVIEIDHTASDKEQPVLVVAINGVVVPIYRELDVFFNKG